MLHAGSKIKNIVHERHEKTRTGSVLIFAYSIRCGNKLWGSAFFVPLVLFVDSMLNLLRDNNSKKIGINSYIYEIEYVYKNNMVAETEQMTNKKTEIDILRRVCVFKVYERDPRRCTGKAK